MPTRHVIVSAHNGVHARPVAELARLVQTHGIAVTLRTSDGIAVDARSVLAVMDLALASGDAVTLEAPDVHDADALLDALAEVLAPAA
jgi:phosphocarrier protein HPr